MRTATIRLHLRCNLRCGFCHARGDRDEPRFAATHLHAQIDAALAAGVEEVVLTGGEPTLRSDLAELVERSGRTGARVVVETNAMALSLPGRCAQLVAAGRPVIRWGIAALGTQLDDIAARPGAFELGLQGVQKAVKSGLKVEIAYALTTAGAADVPRLPEWIATHLPQVTTLLLRVIKEAPDHFVMRPQTAGLLLRDLARSCRAQQLTLVLDPRYALPLCVVRGGNQLPELFRVASGGAGDDLVRVAACAQCAITDLCAGVDKAWTKVWGDGDFEAIAPRHRRRAMGLAAGRAAQKEQQRGCEDQVGEGVGSAGIERVVRLNFHCNQDCTFCFVDRLLPAPPSQDVRGQIERAAADGVGQLSFSGGEPTLDPNLVEHIRLARSLGLRVQLQTNAIRAADANLTKRLADAGLREAFVSLHSADAATSDAITRSPGTFVQTLRGIDQFLAHGVEVTINCVITGPNHGNLADMPRFIAKRWGKQPILNFAWATASTGMVPIADSITPPFSTVRPELAAAIAACDALSLYWSGLTGQCGITPCFVEPGWINAKHLRDLGTIVPPPGFLKPASCDSCAISNRCVGIRQGYVDLYGDKEAAPVKDFASWHAATRNSASPPRHT